MSDDVKCPYCGKEVEINHDDGNGYEEDKLHQQTCPHCDKTFVFTTSISYYYESYYYEAVKADCLNDGEHKWRVNTGYPKGYLSNYHTCTECGEQEMIDKTLKYNHEKDCWEEVK